MFFLASKAEAVITYVKRHYYVGNRRKKFVKSLENTQLVSQMNMYILA